MKDASVVTKSEILKKIPELKTGSFNNYLHQAGIVSIGEKRIGYNLAKVYPKDSIEKILTVMQKKNK